MKRFNHFIRTFQSYLFTRTFIYFTLFSIIISALTYSCGNRYVNDKMDLDDDDSIEDLSDYANRKKKYFIFHDNTDVVHLDGIYIDEEQQQIQAKIFNLEKTHNVYRPKSGERSNPYKKKVGNPIDEIHLYSNSNFNLEAGQQVDIPLSSIDSIVVYGPDNTHQFFKVLGITAGTIVVVAAIVAATKGSCPFVYSNDGEKYTFEGELYPGATRPSLERLDYLQLKHLKQKNELYSIKVSNELMEIQHTNSLVLLEVIHPENTVVKIDQYGNVHSIENPVQPEIVKLGNIILDKKIVSEEDSQCIQFNAIHDENEFQSLYLKFTNPEVNEHAKLLLTLKNSYWMDYTFGKFYEKFGSAFNEFQEKNRYQSKEETTKWMREQGLFLDVKINTKSGWKKVETLNLIGPLKNRDVVVPLNLKGLYGDSVELRLNCGFMFWEIDKIGLDYSKNEHFSINRKLPVHAIDQNGKDITSTILSSDNKYLIQPKIGDFTEIKFQASQVTHGMKISTFLENSGFYEYIRNYEGNPNVSELKEFKKPGAFTRFSKDSYYQFIMKEKSINELISATK